MDIEIDMPHNPDVKTIKLLLTRIEILEQEAWERFQQAKIQTVP